MTTVADLRGARDHAPSRSNYFYFQPFFGQKLYQARMHSGRMRTARSSGHPGGSPSGTPHPSSRGGDPRKETPPVNRITDACENITLPKLRCGR